METGKITAQMELVDILLNAVDIFEKVVDISRLMVDKFKKVIDILTCGR
ncbi:hypothetical protein [Mesobacillus selenatarsenatis]|uniref:Uncharacterized protein n=1 Tax=Mesobacillus selenatarsenatis (strain DSM 18680 / JCM 14380 / FERM P-15431 / SF-1) TaxID=1321606 RepID=A0A0A8XB98_MESS1|nr:hypothetical protein [Mesobacillus selenatarsenatis]GAM15391.1 hypothetical protein SAMD00020551_3548 [Mesobacillus selenatarsenatis SF-1]